MNILTKYTKTSLLKNKTRTVVTVIGIILSVAMFTAVTEAIASAQQFMIDYVKQTKGSYHALAPELDTASAASLAKEKDVKDCESLDFVGYADIGSENTYKPYLYIASMSDGFADMVAINLKSGRLPENSGEIILPYHLFENGNVKIQSGQTLDLQAGIRKKEDRELYQLSSFEEGEKLMDTSPKTYTVVGFYERFDFSVENYSAPGYTAITVGEQGGIKDVFFTFKSIYNAREKVEELFGVYGPVVSNNELIRLYGSFGSDAITQMVGGFAVILMGLIAFGSVSLVYNSFSISISERTKQFGMLKSVGATKRQIRSTVIKEALMLCIVGVPLGLLSGCAGIGITLSLISDKFNLLLTKLFASAKLPTSGISLHVSPSALLIAATIGVVTALISAYIPARRAVRITPLEAVRQSSDIKIKRGKIKKYRLTRKIFGFEAMIAAKNFARNKKRYRAAVMSMFMSIVLFISASSFCDYLTNAVKAVTNDVGYDIRVFMHTSHEESQFLLDIDSAKKAAYTASDVRDVYFSDDLLAPEYKAAFTGKFVHNVAAIFVDDANYNKLVKDNNLRENGGAVLINQYRSHDEKGKVTVYPVINQKTAGEKITVSLPKEVDGYYYSDFNGESFNYYEMTDRNEQKHISLSFDEALKEQTFNVAGFINEKPFFVENNGLVAIYPVSAMPKDNFVSNAYYAADDFAACQEELERAFTDRSIGYTIYNYAEENASNRALATIINVFSYGFIVLISLIALANVFNTITTNIHLRKRELAMLKSVGMTKHSFNKMMNYECLICGIRALLFGLPVATGVTYLIYRAANSGFGTDFYLPAYSVITAVFSVFAVIFLAMLYSMHKLRKENVIETLRNENI
ncbi:MAG: ABC transporter permease [Clostridia bacterium]|nr:ABC transporter permease [Clostridia bacterium]